MAYFTRLFGERGIVALIALLSAGAMLYIGQVLVSMAPTTRNSLLVFSGLGLVGLVLGVVFGEGVRLVVLNAGATAFDTRRTVMTTLFGGLAIAAFGTYFLISIAKATSGVEWQWVFLYSVVVGTPLVLVCVEQAVLRVGGRTRGSFSESELEAIVDEVETEGASEQTSDA